MPVDTRKQLQKTIRERKYLNRDFDNMKSDLEEYARTYFPDRIKDFSSNGLGGMLLEMAAYIGDVQSFYLDHQFQELSPETAVESRNIERMLRDNGVQIVGASPAVVDVTFYFKIPVAKNTVPATPDTSALPIVYAGTVVQAQNGTTFELTDDIDFTEKDYYENYKFSKTIGDVDSTGNIVNFILSRTGICISGQRGIDTFSTVGFEPFKQYTLSKENVTDILSVKDSAGNVYYEVDFLTQDTVFNGIPNVGIDGDLVEENLEIIPAAYRFYTATSLQTRLTTLTFGGGTAETMDDDIVPDPSEFAVPLYGKKTFSRFALNPTNLLRTATLGVIASNVNITVEYRYGGGLTHNIEPNSIRGVSVIRLGFPNNPTTAIAAAVRTSIDATNLSNAAGGDDAPTLDELKLRIPGSRSAQSRTVTKEDLIARIYTMPPNFGRVFRASVHTNKNNPNAAKLYIICRNSNNELIIAPDALKKNLSKYLNEYRLISDAIDILDAQVVNLKIEYKILVDVHQNKQVVLQNINARLRSYFNIKNFELDQPLSISDLHNIIYNSPGVMGVGSGDSGIVISNINGRLGDRTYSNTQFSVQQNTFKGNLIIPPEGGMFEIKFKDVDIQGTCI